MYPYSLGILTEWKPLWYLSLPEYLVLVSLLARDINWMETQTAFSAANWLLSDPYSLGILTEWKLLVGLVQVFCTDYPYSLGILTEWKPFSGIYNEPQSTLSLLARDINWMETWWQPHIFRVWDRSLLARDINWMETFYPNLFKFGQAIIPTR